jgi:hypothetical protein
VGKVRLGKMTKELSSEEFQKTFGKQMIDVTETSEPVINIWPYIEQLKNEKIVLPYVFENELVEKVARNADDNLEHVLLPTDRENIFIVIVVDLTAKTILGHHRLNLEKEYGFKY